VVIVYVKFDGYVYEPFLSAGVSITKYKRFVVKYSNLKFCEIK